MCVCRSLGQEEGRREGGRDGKRRETYREKEFAAYACVCIGHWDRRREGERRETYRERCAAYVCVYMFLGITQRPQRTLFCHAVLFP